MKHLLSILCLLLIVGANAQIVLPDSLVADHTEFGFPGGEKAMYKFISDSIQYPQVAKESGCSGAVYVIFTVTTEGDVTDIKILRSPNCEGRKEMEAEVIRVIGLMPRWEPAIQNGKKVAVQINLPIKFYQR